MKSGYEVITKLTKIGLIIISSMIVCRCINAIEIRSCAFNKIGISQKCTNASWTFRVMSVPTYFRCIALCTGNNTCGAVNYNSVLNQNNCELLPIISRFPSQCQMDGSQIGWSLYPKKRLAYYNSSSNSVCLPFAPYEPSILPLDQYYACTTNSFIVDLWNSGKKDCRFTILYDTQSSDGCYPNVGMEETQEPTMDVNMLKLMSKSLESNLLSVKCYGSTNFCYAKTWTPAANPNCTATYQPDTVFWVSNCE